ncbi:hypothetical protein [Desulfonatronovibrio magnus]|uniref:hypothetical protein n=1 Tax=Desulfonatronovibrio magnus TaxID=698827 RepID=UPI0005EBDAFF|nr:hypothetical protein [Desulfonatronovibrio magnus]
MFKLKLTVNGKTVTLGNESVEDVLYSIPDKRKFNPIVAEFAKSPIPQVRMDVASRSSINKEIVSMLLEDTQIDVLRNLVLNHNAHGFIPENSLLRLIETDDFDILETIVGNLDSFSQCDEDVLAETLCKTKNPKVRMSLAENELIDQEILEILSRDEDQEVADKALATLESIQEEIDLEDDEN